MLNPYETHWDSLEKSKSERRKNFSETFLMTAHQSSLQTKEQNWKQRCVV